MPSSDSHPVAGLFRLAQGAVEASDGQSVLHTLIDLLSVAVYTTDGQGRLTHFNRACETLSGRTPDIGTDQWCVSWKLYYPDGRPMPHDECPMAIALQQGRPVRGKQAILERPDGTRVWFEPYPVPVLDANGAVIGGINVLVDVTKRKRVEASLRKSREELADFFENSAVGLHWVGPDGTILRANHAELDLLGYERDEYIGHNITEFHADAAVIEDILQKLQAGETLTHYEARLKCKDGTVKHVLIDSNVLWEDGCFVHTRCFTRDVTDQKQAERERELVEDQLYRNSDELSRFNKAAVGRELRMIELKKEINELRERLGEAPRYPLRFEGTPEHKSAP